MQIEKIKENIDQLLQGRLSATETSALEDLIKSNPLVANEFALQKEITTAIKADRVAALKARLDQIPVSGGGISGNNTAISIGYKAAAIAVITVGVGIAGYLYLSQQDPNTGLVAIKENRVEDAKTLSDDSHKTLSNTKSGQILANKNSTSHPNSKRDEKANDATSVKLPDPVYSTQSKSISSPDWKIFKRKIKAEDKKVPNLDAFVDDSQANVKSDTKSPEELTAEVKIEKTSDVDIKNIQDGSHHFHYKLKNNVLFLYGSFDASPYEILEFNDKQTQVLYLYYDAGYYAMKPNQEQIAKLKKITDQKLISDLDQARAR